MFFNVMERRRYGFEEGLCELLFSKIRFEVYLYESSIGAKQGRKAGQSPID